MEQQKITHAQTCDPFSGIMVKRALSLSRRTHAILPMKDKDAVNSVICQQNTGI